MITVRGSRTAPVLTGLLLAAAAVLAGLAIADGGAAPGVAADRLIVTGLRGAYRDLFVQALDGAPIALTDDTALDGEAAFSPDGARIAFVSDRGGSLDLWLMAADGSGVRQLTDDPATEVSPAWSPDGERLAFISDREGDRTNIFVVEVASGVESQITFQDRGLAFLDWSPDGASIAYSAAGADHPTDPALTPLELVVIPAGGGEAVVVEDGGGWNWGAAWAPAGDRIAFSWTPQGVAATEVAWLQIINADGSGLRRLEQGAWGDYAPAWSPDGERIAFTSTRGGVPQVYVWDLRTDTITLALGGMTAFDPDWAPR